MNYITNKIGEEGKMIRNPAFPGDPVYDMAFNLYAMEEEGLLPTHRGTLNNLCKILNENNISTIVVEYICVNMSEQKMKAHKKKEINQKS